MITGEKLESVLQCGHSSELSKSSLLNCGCTIISCGKIVMFKYIDKKLDALLRQMYAILYCLKMFVNTTFSSNITTEY